MKVLTFPDYIKKALSYYLLMLLLAGISKFIQWYALGHYVPRFIKWLFMPPYMSISFEWVLAIMTLSFSLLVLICLIGEKLGKNGC